MRTRARAAFLDGPKAAAGTTSGNLMIAVLRSEQWRISCKRLARCERFLLPDVDHESIWNRQTSVNCLFDKTANCALSG